METEKNKIISREDGIQMRNESFKKTGKQVLKDLLVVPTILALTWVGSGIYRTGEFISEHLPESEPRAVWYNEGSDLVRRDLGGYRILVDEDNNGRVDSVQSKPYRGSSISKAPTGLDQKIFENYQNSQLQ